MLAEGPLDAKPVDSELRAMGWAQFYDDSDAIEAADGARARFYDERGAIRDELLPLEWERPAFMRPFPTPEAAYARAVKDVCPTCGSVTIDGYCGLCL